MSRKQVADFMAQPLRKYQGASFRLIFVQHCPVRVFLEDNKIKDDLKYREGRNEIY